MSSYHVLRTVTGAIRLMLWEAISADVEFAGIVGSPAEIVTMNPKRTAEKTANKLSVWLYHVAENEFLKNQPTSQENGGTRPPPLALDLSYLITPMVFADSEESNHNLLGKVMQVMYDNADLVVRDVDDRVAERLSIVLSRLSILELAELWESLQEDYRLSVCYQVRLVRVDSLRLTAQARVIDRIAAVGALSGPG
jgi:hypothetical protein